MGVGRGGRRDSVRRTVFGGGRGSGRDRQTDRETERKGMRDGRREGGRQTDDGKRER